MTDSALAPLAIGDSLTEEIEQYNTLTKLTSRLASYAATNLINLKRLHADCKSLDVANLRDQLTKADSAQNTTVSEYLYTGKGTTPFCVYHDNEDYEN